MATIKVEVKAKTKNKERKLEQKTTNATLQVPPQNVTHMGAEMSHQPNPQPLLWQAPERNTLSSDPRLPGKPELICTDCHHREHFNLQEAQTLATKGDPTAQVAIAKLYEETENLKTRFGVMLDEEQATLQGMAWLHKAALQGSIIARKKLAYQYREKFKDESSAFYWFHMAASQDDIESQLEVGFCYFEGIGVASSVEDAADWFDNVLLNETDKYEAEKEVAKKMLGNIYCLSQVRSDNFDEKTLSEFAKIYFEDIYKTANATRNKVFQNAVAICYARGRGVAADLKQAAEWFKKAADQGFDQAHYSLGCMLKQGKGIPQDLQSAFLSFKKAAAHGLPEGQFELGLAYKLGSGTAQNDAAAILWFAKAAELGHAEAKLEQSFAYREGRGVLQSNTEAFILCQAAAAQGLDKAQVALAEMYIDAIGVARDLKIAAEILTNIEFDCDYRYGPEEWNPVLEVARVKGRIAELSNKRCCVIL